MKNISLHMMRVMRTGLICSAVATTATTMVTSAIAQTKETVPTQKTAPAPSKEHPKPKDLQPVDDAPALISAPPPPQIKDNRDDPTLEAKVTTVKKGTDTVEEYRVNGKLYKMRVVPASGPAYILVDAKGDGSFARVDGPDLKMAVPTWVLFEWK